LRTTSRPSEAGEPAILDSVDRAVILELQRDGRMSYSKLGERIGLSQAAARQRVNKLVESGVMEIVAVTDPLKLGFRIQADLGIKVTGDPRPVVATLEALPEVEYLRYTAGRFEIMAEVVFETQEMLHEFVNVRLRGIVGVEQVETLIVLQRVKETHDWGVPDTMTDE
jgi:Lrp/AsnC family transcriptional regulator for asnA, asnC and gidA